MKPKYEISIWQDDFDKDLNRFIEKKILVIGSNTMTSENRAREPKMVSNINGTNKFTFNMYYNYIDTRTGEKIQNLYIPYLVNERKIKVLWKDEWYDLLIKQIKEDQVNHLFTYTCEDAYITELSRTGFELEFNTELQNNIGTAKELVESVIKNTDWRFELEDPEDPIYERVKSDNIYQETEEAVYEVLVKEDFKAIQEPCRQGEEKEVTIYKGTKILIFYSQAPDADNLKSPLQFYYTGGKFICDENEMLVTNGTSYRVSVEWEKKDDNQALAKIDGNEIFTLTFTNGISQEYRAKRFVNSDKTSYNSILKRYVNDFNYNEEIIHGYQTTEFNDVSVVVNLFTNPSNFANISGWTPPENMPMTFKLYPPFDKNTIVSEYNATSFLRFNGGETYYNSGILNNRAYIPNGFIEGEEYIFRLKVREGDGDSPVDNYISPQVNFIIKDNTQKIYFQLVGNNNRPDENNWNTYHLKCQNSCSFNNIKNLALEINLIIGTKGFYYWVEDIQFYRQIKGEVIIGEKTEQTILEPNQVNSSAIAQNVWKYYRDKDNKNIIDNKDFTYMYTSLKPLENAIQLTNDYMRFGTIEEDNSNRFNILQSIAETFECWVRFYIDHDEKGSIKYDDNGPRKFVYLRKEAGQETGIGFIYGVDLKGIVRNVKSDKISTKTIVQDNDNEFGQNGFCSIARSLQNYTRDNVIYNFDYYISHGLLDKETVYTDFYQQFNSGSGYYMQLHYLNTTYDENLKSILNKKIELNRQTASYTVYDQYVSAAQEEINKIEDNLFKLTNTTNITSAITYANNHPKNVKVLTLLNDRTFIKNDKEHYKKIRDELSQNIEKLQEQINGLLEAQNYIIEQLTELNEAFYKKYARFIQEGTWTSEDYWDDTLYYLDAIQVAYTSSRPQVSYEINVLRLSDLDDYSSKKFYLGDISFVQDTEYFGYLSDKITPYKERVVLTEITSFFETPDKDTIKVQNYKTQFDDLFQRITAAVQSLEFNEGKYARVSNIVNDDGTIKSGIIQNTFNINKDLVYGAQNESATIDDTGITVVNTADKEKIVRITSGGVFITDDGGTTWKNAVRGDGISADTLTAGHIDTEKIVIYNGNYPSFCWDPYGLNAYRFDEKITGGVDTSSFVRFDQYGIYGIQNGDIDFKPDGTNLAEKEQDIFEKAKFGLTWNQFFMKTRVGSNAGVTITSNNGIEVRNNAEEILFRCSPNSIEEGSDIAAQIGGWEITQNSIKSTIKDVNNYIAINADGNIGCYGGEEQEYWDYVYIIEVDDNIPDELLTRFSDGEKATIKKGDIIYPFFNSVGKTKVEFSEANEDGTINSNYTDPNNVPEKGKLAAPGSLVFAMEEGNEDITYKISKTKNLGLLITPICVSAEGRIDYQINPKTGANIPIIIYTYKYSLKVSYTQKKDENSELEEIELFTIPYTEIITQEEADKDKNGKTIPTPQKKRYVPSANTKWSIDKDGTAVFHEIIADGGEIAGWFIDNEKIYQTTNGERDGPIKTQLNSTGTAKGDDGLDYSVITDAINAAMGTIGGMLMSGGLINGYSIAEVAQLTYEALNQANAAMSQANAAMAKANSADSFAHSHRHDYVAPGTITVDGKDYYTGGNITQTGAGK